MLTTHKKFFVALVGAALIGLNSFFGFDIGFEAEAVVNTVLAVLTAIGVERFANDPAE